MDPKIVEIKEALKNPDASIRFVQTFSHGLAVQVYVKTRKIGPFILPADGQSVADVLHMLGTLRVEN